MPNRVPIDAAGRRVNLSEFEVEQNPHLSYDDVLDAVQDDAFHVALAHLDPGDTEPDTDERCSLYDTDARRVRDEFEAHYRDELLRIIEARS